MTKTLISSRSRCEEQIAYSRAVVDGEWIFVSGTTGFDYSTMSISDKGRDNPSNALKNIQHALRQAGGGLVEYRSEVVVNPEETHWGTRWFVVKDPDGNLLAYEQANSKASET